MTEIVTGKEAVLEYLENRARQRTGGNCGLYRLFVDDTGIPVAFIAGHGFSGEFTLSKETVGHFEGIPEMSGRNGLMLDPDQPQS